VKLEGRDKTNTIPNCVPYVNVCYGICIWDSICISLEGGLMSQQISLFGKTEEVVVITTKKKTKKPEKVEEIEEEDYQPDDNPLSEKEETEEQTFEIAEEIKDDKYGWTQLPKERRAIGFAFVHLQLLSSTDLNGTRYAVTMSTEYQQPNSMLGSMFGCGGDTFKLNNLEEIQNFFDDIMEMKKNRLQEPYREFTKTETEIKYEHHNIYYDFRLIPAKNFFVVIGDKLVEMITKTGFDFDKWYQEYRDLPEHLATDEDWAKAHENLKLREEGDEVVNKLEAIDTVLKTNQDLKDTLDFFTKTKDELIQEFRELPLKLREISDKIMENEKSLGMCRYSVSFSWELERYTGVINYGKKGKN